jgi:hypothetical protein
LASFGAELVYRAHEADPSVEADAWPVGGPDRAACRLAEIRAACRLAEIKVQD